MHKTQTEHKAQSTNRERGVSLILTILILSSMLALGLGVSTLLITELRFAREVGRFIPAIYAADAGIEHALHRLRKTSQFPGPCDSETACTIPATALTNGASYSAVIVDPGVAWCPVGASNFCIRSFGNFLETRRALEVAF